MPNYSPSTVVAKRIDVRRDPDVPSAAGSSVPRGGRIVQSSGVISCPRPDGTVLVDVGGGRRITLDLFGSRVWRQLADQPTLPALVARLRDDGSSAERLAEDVTRLLARWDATGVIAWR